MSRTKGFSLAELLVSLAVLSSLAVVMLGVMPSTIFGLHQAGERATAATLAQQTLEQLREQGPALVRAATYPGQTLNNVQYIVQVTYQSAVGTDGLPLDPTMAADVTVSVRWKSRGGDKVYSARDLMGSASQ